MICVQGLRKSYGAIAAVDDLSFDVRPGVVTGFLGPNGAGKTTTLRIALGLATPDAGSVKIDGRAYADIRDPMRTVGAVLESSGFHPGRTGREHLHSLAAAVGLPRSRAGEVLETVGLGDAADRRVKGYSLGMRQRLGLAAALLGEPEILILDEPGNGLDPGGLRWLRGLLQWIAREGGTVLVSSHLLTEMASLAAEVVIVAKGRLVSQASMSDLLARAPGGDVLARSPDAVRLVHALEARGGHASLAPDGAVSIRGIPMEQVGDIAAGEDIVLHELRTLDVGLEDVFLMLTARQPGASGDPGLGSMGSDSPSEPVDSSPGEQG